MEKTKGALMKSPRQSKRRINYAKFLTFLGVFGSYIIALINLGIQITIILIENLINKEDDEDI